MQASVLSAVLSLWLSYLRFIYCVYSDSFWGSYLVLGATSGSGLGGITFVSAGVG